MRVTNLFFFHPIVRDSFFSVIFTVMIRKNGNGRMGRRRFAGLLGGILLGFLALLTGRMTRRTRRLNEKKSILLPGDLPEGISFAERIIIVRKGKQLTFLSSRCTHLGCRISESVDGHLQCPCHGSEFAADGSVIKGPATKGLKQLAWKKDKDTGRFEVEL